MSEIEQKARELLAAELKASGHEILAVNVELGTAVDADDHDNPLNISLRAIARALEAAPKVGETPEHVRRLIGRIDQFRLCMSYNESYFGEPVGLLKGVFAELGYAANPIYPDGTTALHPPLPAAPTTTTNQADPAKGAE